MYADLMVSVLRRQAVPFATAYLMEVPATPENSAKMKCHSTVLTRGTTIHIIQHGWMAATNASVNLEMLNARMLSGALQGVLFMQQTRPSVLLQFVQQTRIASPKTLRARSQPVLNLLVGASQ